MGLGGLEPPASPLSGVRSGRLSYRPQGPPAVPAEQFAVGAPGRAEPRPAFFKDVIQPQVPLWLPCYDFTPVTNHTVAGAPPKVGQPASGAARSHGVTGGVYKARERIHRGVLIRDY